MSKRNACLFSKKLVPKPIAITKGIDDTYSGEVLEVLSNEIQTDSWTIPETEKFSTVLRRPNTDVIF